MEEEIVLELEESDFAGYIAEDTPYRAQIVAIHTNVKPFLDDDGQAIKRIEFSFQIESDDAHDGRILKGDTSMKFTRNDNCKLYNWTEMILGIKLPPQFTFRSSLLLDKSVRIIVGLKEYEKVDKVTGRTEDKQYNYVKDLMPTTAAMAAMAGGGLDDEPF